MEMLGKCSILNLDSICIIYKTFWLNKILFIDINLRFTFMWKNIKYPTNSIFQSLDSNNMQNITFLVEYHFHLNIYFI